MWDQNYEWDWKIILDGVIVIVCKEDIIEVKEEREKAVVVASSELGHESYGGQAQGRRFHWIGLDCGLNYSWNLILKLLSSNYSGHAGASTTTFEISVTGPHTIYLCVLHILIQRIRPNFFLEVRLGLVGWICWSKILASLEIWPSKSIQT